MEPTYSKSILELDRLLQVVKKTYFAIAFSRNHLVGCLDDFTACIYGNRIASIRKITP